MRSENAYSRWIAFVLVLFGVVIALLVVWLVLRTLMPVHTVVHERTRTGPTLVLVQPPSTPLRDSIREPGAASRRSVSGRRAGSTSSSRVRGSTGSPVAPVKHPTRVGPKASTGLPKRRKRRTAPHPHQTAPAPQSPPSAPEKPLLTVTVPAPASACVKGVGGVNC